MGPLVLAVEGTLARFSGDGMMMFFNDPQPMADAPARAVSMAPDTQGEVVERRLQRQRLRPGPIERRKELMMRTTTFEAFKADALTAGFDEVVERRWAPHAVIDTHSHAFGVEAVVTQGDMWLTCEGSTRHLTPGSSFSLAVDVPHAERYGAEGATYWVARRSSR